MADDEKIPEIDIKARQTSRHTRVTVDVPATSPQTEREEERKKLEAEREEHRKEREERAKQREERKKQEEQKEEGSGPTIAGYTLDELIRAPLEPPDEKEVGKRSTNT